MRVLLQPGRKERLCDSALRIVGKRLEHRRPDCVDHDGRIDILAGTPSLRKVFWANARIGRLHRLDQGHEQSRGLRSSAFRVQVLEPADDVDPIDRKAIAVPVIAAVEEQLQLVPARVEVLVGQRAAAHS